MLRQLGNRRSGHAGDRKALIRVIHTIAGQLAPHGFDEEARRAMQRQLTGQDSCRDMDLAQLQKVCRTMQVMADALPHATTRRRDRRDERLPGEAPTREQLELIEHLRAHVGLHASELWMNLCRRILKHPWPQSREEASKIIEALKAMEARGWKAHG
jgi:hypothetical protein